jgi:hypothetical protein
MHYQGFCEAASIIGKVKEIDMSFYQKSEIIRAKVGVKDQRKIPASAELNDEDFIYDIWFELEDIVEQGEPMLGGGLVIHSGQGLDGVSVGVKHNEEKKQREAAVGEQREMLKSPRNVGFDKLEDVTEVVSSQYELKKKKEIAVDDPGVESRILLEKKALADEEMSEEQEDYVAEELAYDCTQDPDAFARKLGLSTQRIEDIITEIDEEEEKENCMPANVDTNQSGSGSCKNSGGEDMVQIKE